MLYEIYEDMLGHPNLLHVQQHFGSEYLHRITAYPSIVWVPGKDNYDDPYGDRIPIDYGTHQQFDSCYLRKAGCKLHLYHKDYKEMEILINTLHNCLYDVLISHGNFAIGDGVWRTGNEYQQAGKSESKQISENTVAYLQDLTVFVPIYRLLPAARVDTTNVTTN